MTRVVGLTGSVGAGKSTVAALFQQWGTTVIDADALVRELQQPDQPVFHAIVAHFGSSIVRPDGELDRAALRRTMLDSVSARRELESIVHPAVERHRRLLVASARGRGVPLVVVDIPLLFEATDPREFDGVIVVDAPEAERRERLIAHRGLSATEADQLMAAQLPAASKRARASWVIENDADPATLERRARAVWEEVQR